MEVTAKIQHYWVDFGSLLLIFMGVMGVLGIGFAYYFSATQREEMAFFISFACLILSLISIGIGIFLAIIRRRGLMLGSVGTILTILGGPTVVGYITSEFSTYSRVGYAHQFYVQDALPRVIVSLFITVIGLGLIALYIVSGQKKNISTTGNRELIT